MQTVRCAPPFVLGLCAVCAWCALSGQKVAGALSSLASFRRSRIARGAQPPGYKAHGASAAGPVALVFVLPFGGEQRALGKGAGVGRWAMAILAGVAACFIAFKACSKSFHACASATHGRGRNAHRNQDCPFWQGVQQRAWSLAALPEGGCFAKAASAVLQVLARQAARLFRVSCFAPCSYCFCKARHTM